MFPSDPLDLTFQTLLSTCSRSRTLACRQGNDQKCEPSSVLLIRRSPFSVMMNKGAQSKVLLEHENEMLQLMAPFSDY